MLQQSADAVFQSSDYLPLTRPQADGGERNDDSQVCCLQQEIIPIFANMLSQIYILTFQNLLTLV